MPPPFKVIQLYGIASCLTHNPRVCNGAIRCVVAALALMLGAAAPSYGAEALPDFDQDVRPILAAHCFKCHGPNKQNSDVRFDILSTDLINDRPAAELSLIHI